MKIKPKGANKMSERVRKKTGRMPAAPLEKKGKQSLFKNFFHSGRIDVAFCCLVMILFAFGITMMYSAGYAYASAYRSSANEFFFNQLKWGLLGFAAMALISKIDYKILNGILTPIAFVLMIMILAYALISNRGADTKRWIYIGSFQFQPSELAKFVLILVMAYMICILYKPLNAEKGKRATPAIRRLTTPEKLLFGFIDTNFKSTVALAAVVVIFCGFVMLESHLSCTILLFFLGVAMMWLGGVDKKWFVLLFALMAVAVVVVVYKPDLIENLPGNGYARIMTWKTKTDFKGTTRWQTEQGLYAIGSGGPFGVGFGKSRQKQLFIPEPQNDFIFAVLCEELGFFGAAVMIILFAALIFRGFAIATKTKDLFGALLVMGIMMQLGIQVVLNIAVVTDVIPNTGIALPFFSYGGTAMFVLLCEMGVVLSVSRTSRLEETT